MRLYSWDIAPNPRRVRIYLAEKGLDVPIEDVGVPGKPVLRPDFLAKFGHRRVPLLELDDGACIGEAMAICRYFELLHPDPPLMGGDPRDAALIEMWERLAEWEGLHALSEAFRNSRKSFAGRALAGYGAPMPQIPALAERGAARLKLFHDKFDAQLEDHEFVAGEGYSVADITTLCTVDFAEFCGLGMPDGCANLRRWHETVSARPSATA